MGLSRRLTFHGSRQQRINSCGFEFLSRREKLVERHLVAKLNSILLKNFLVVQSDEEELLASLGADVLFEVEILLLPSA